MNLILYPPAETDFENNGLGVLSDATSATVTEKLNGTFELSLRYPTFGLHAQEIQDRCIILAKPDPVSDPQPFRVYRVNPSSNGTLAVYARHICYDAMGVTVAPFSADSIADALAKIPKNAVNACPFTFFTDKNIGSKFTCAIPKTAWDIMGGVEGSLLDTYGGEYQYDRYKISLLKRRGEDRGVSIRYGKNLQTVDQDKNCADCYTGVYPYWLAMDESELVQLPEKILRADGDYGYDKIMTLDLSLEFDAAPSESELRERAENYMADNAIGTPDVSWNVKFAQLEQSTEYAEYAPLERVFLGDTVTVFFAKMGVDASARVVEAVYDPILCRYNNVTLGKVKQSIVTTVAKQQQETARKPELSTVEKIAASLDKAISGANGGCVRLLDTNGDGKPDELYIADSDDQALAVKVWRFNYMGWAASKNGYNGPFEMGATLEDGLLANFVTAANLKAGTIASMDGESFFADLDNNIIRIKLVSEATSKAEAAQATADAAVKDLNNYAERVAGSLTDLQNQIDGAIETWFYDYQPTAKNAPASAWTTTEDKNKHLGDLFYIVDNDELGGQIYRWALVNGVYSWVLVEDTEVAKALETAAQAKDTADGKRRVFVEKPTPPYDVGDLWTDGADLRVCKVARASGSYTASDWELATEYIDAEVAQAKADVAEKSANEYASAQIKIAKDSILQSVESQYTTKSDFSKAVTSVQEQYYQSVSASTTVGGSWSTSEPTWSEGIYIWNRRLVTYGDGTTGYEPSERGVCVTGNTGAKGDKGDVGNGIKSIAEYYQVSASNTTAPTSWATAPPTMTATNKYLWNYEVITYTSGSTASTEKRVIGVYGDQGTKGDAGRGIKSTSTTYQAGASGTTAPTGTWTKAVPATSASKPYLWTKTVITYTDGTTSTAYAVGSTIAGVEIGGRNLLLDSDFLVERTSAATTTYGKSIKVDSTHYADLVGKTVTLSYLVSAPGDRDMSLSSNASMRNRFGMNGTITWVDSTGETVSTTTTYPLASKLEYSGDRQRVAMTVTLTPPTGYDAIKNFYISVTMYAKPAAANDATWVLGYPKLEVGNKATDWTPAPEDINTAIEDANERIDTAVKSITETQTNLKVLQEQTDERWAVTATKEEVSSTVTEAVGNVQVGGRNLARNTSSEWSDWITPKTGANSTAYVSTGYYPELKALGDAFTAQFEIEFADVGAGEGGAFRFHSQGDVDGSWNYPANRINPFYAVIKMTEPPADGICKCVKTTVIKDSAYVGRSTFKCGFRADYWNGVGKYRVRCVKVEIGNKATDWTPAPEDTDAEIDNLTADLSSVKTRVENAETQISATQEEVNLRATVDYVDTTVKEVTDGFVEKTTFEEYQRSAEAELSVMADKVGISVSEQLRQEIKSGDDEILSLYNELRMNYDFTADGQYIGKKDSDTLMRLVNDMMQILVAGVAATTVDRNGLTASQANVKTLHLGTYTLAYGNGKLTLT